MRKMAEKTRTPTSRIQRAKSWNFGLGTPAHSYGREVRRSLGGASMEFMVPASDLEDTLTRTPKDLKPPSPPSQPVHDCFYRDLSGYVPLYLAALKGDWNKAADIFAEDPYAPGAAITETLETALHIASGAKRTEFVQKIVEKMTVSQLRMRNFVGHTALCFAAATGIVEIAEAMVEKDKDLIKIRGGHGASPLYSATLLGREKMVWYLYRHMKDDLDSVECAGLLVAALTSDLYDFAVALLQQYPDIANPNDDTVMLWGGNNETAFHVLARKPQVYYSGHHFSFLKRLIYHSLSVDVLENFLTSTESSDKSNHISKVPYLGHIYNQKMMHVKVFKILEAISQRALTRENNNIGACVSTLGPLVFRAAELGTVEFLVVLIQSYPDFFWKVNEDGHTIFHVAVIHRQEKVFCLINEIGALKDHITLLKDTGRNNMLHLVARRPPQNRLETDCGAALQLRKEIFWFKAVEKIMQPSYIDMENGEGKTPQSLFTEQHKVLVKEGQKWMEKTSASCMVVSTLIATVTFAAMFTVPGGNNGESGIPIFQGGKAFRLFAISNSASLICSATSMLTFLSILTSRYAEQDFVQSLPRSLLIGLTTLFISVTTMMVAFGATLFLVVGHGFRWFTIAISIASGINILWFAWLHLPLFVDIVAHTYNSRKLFQQPMHLFEIKPL